MPIQLPHTLSQLNVSNLPNAIDSSGDILGKAVDVQILDDNFSKLSQVVNVSATAPVDMYEGMLWLDTTNGIIKMWSGSAWVSMTDLTSQIKVASSAPSNPATGTVWLDTTTGIIKMWSGEEWISCSMKHETGGAINYVPNGSFEYDTNNDGIPDFWTRVLYTGGSGGFAPGGQHGGRSYRFTHPGGAGKGGGYLESDFIEVDQRTRYVVTFIMFSSVAGIKNMVNVIYFKGNKTDNGTATIFTSTSNPATQQKFAAAFTPPADTRYIKIQLVGGYNDTDVVGHTTFDAVSLSPILNLTASIYRRDDTERSTTSTSFVDTATQFTIHDAYANVPITFTASVRGSNTAGTYDMRWRIGSAFSNTVTTTSTSYVAGTFTVTPTTSGTLTLIMQLRTSSSSYTAFGVKNTDVICIEPS